MEQIRRISCDAPQYI